MNLNEMLLIFTLLWKMCSSLRCYRCKPQIEDYRQDYLCEHFDYSDKYVTECNDSTMCYKREITSSLGYGLKLYERDCAKQIMNDDQVRTDHGWKRVKRIYEVYEEGCEDSSQQGDKVTKTVHCYCRGDRCNAAGVMQSGRLMMLVGMGLVILGIGTGYRNRV